MSVLFSPIGTADPLTQLGDGPMLHIVRHYRPEEVILFLSPAMTEHEKADQRYTKSIYLLCAKTGQVKPEIRYIESETEDVHRFDQYIAEFEKAFKKIAKQQFDGQILVNVSSGTPAMGQALVALGAFSVFDFRLLQVTTPREGPNEKNDREDPYDYDLDILWTLNPDNERQDVACRIEEVPLQNFREKLLRDNIITLIRKYDYSAALQLTKESARLASRALFIQRLVSRINLDTRREDQLAEYLSVMEVRLKQGNWADFCRSLTPALTRTMMSKLRPHLPEENYLKSSGGDFSYELDEDQIRQDSRLHKILSGNLQGSGKHYITNASFCELVKEYCPDSSVKEKVLKLRQFESRSRNQLAHEIVKVSKDELERCGGLTLEQVMQHLFDLNEVEPGLYDRLNKETIDNL